MASFLMGYAKTKFQQLFLSQISNKCSVFTYITSLLKHYSTNQITRKVNKKLDKCNG